MVPPMRNFFRHLTYVFAELKNAIFPCVVDERNELNHDIRISSFESAFCNSLLTFLRPIASKI